MDRRAEGKLVSDKTVRRIALVVLAVLVIGAGLTALPLAAAVVL